MKNPLAQELTKKKIQNGNADRISIHLFVTRNTKSLFIKKSWKNLNWLNSFTEFVSYIMNVNFIIKNQYYEQYFSSH